MGNFPICIEIIVVGVLKINICTILIKANLTHDRVFSCKYTVIYL